MILETVRLLQEGQLEQAEYLLGEGAYPVPPHLTAWPCVAPGWMQLMCPKSLLGGPSDHDNCFSSPRRVDAHVRECIQAVRISSGEQQWEAGKPVV